MNSAARTDRRSRAGTFPNGMSYLAIGDGPRSAIFIEGGPGSDVPTGLMRRYTERRFAPYGAVGYTVWFVTRRRNMPSTHRMPDIADDFAALIADEFGGSVDLVIGESFGGMIAQYLAAQHPDACGALALIISGSHVSDWCRSVDRRLAAALASGDRQAAGRAYAEYVIRDDRMAWARSVLGPPMLGMFPETPESDLLVETRAEIEADTRELLPRISVPVILIAGTDDQFFHPDVVRETARLIPDATLVWRTGAGHLKTGTSGRVHREIVTFLERRGLTTRA